jgi:hypothetical protein
VTFDDPEFQKPRPVRFEPDSMDYAQIAVKKLEEPFTPDLVGLIHDESPMKGCSVVVFDHEQLQEGNACLVKVGRMSPVAALIVWKKEIEPGLIRMGLQYLE